MTTRPPVKPPAQKPAGKSTAAKTFTKAATQATPAKTVAKPQPKTNFLEVDPVNADFVTDGREARRQHTKLLKRIRAQGYIIGALALILVLCMPFFQPIYSYYSLPPQGAPSRLASLPMPNMTNRALLSWATASITEIMTIGFGDYEARLKAQRNRFTSEGWDSFAAAFDKQKIGEQLKERHQVLTTVASNTPVIIAQGENIKKHVYEWHVQMPVIMTYATNDNKESRQKAVIELTIARVPPSESAAGIGISTWKLKD